MIRMFYEDAYCLGLIYAYIYSGKKMVLMDDLKKFHDTIEKNLEEIKSNSFNLYNTVWYDDDPSIYYPSEGKNGEVYYVLYPNFDLEKAKRKYIGCLSTDVLVASQKDNALDCINLKKVDGKIVRKERDIRIGISNSNEFLKQFFDKLNNGQLKIEICSQMGDEVELTEEYIMKQIRSYQDILDSGIIDKTPKKEHILIKK